MINRFTFLRYRLSLYLSISLSLSDTLKQHTQDPSHPNAFFLPEDIQGPIRLRHVQEHFPLTRSDRYEFRLIQDQSSSWIVPDSLWADVRDPEAKVPLFDSDTLFLQVNVMKRGVSEKRKKKKKKTWRKPAITTQQRQQQRKRPQQTSPKSFGSRLFGSTKLFLERLIASQRMESNRKGACEKIE